MTVVKSYGVSNPCQSTCLVITARDWWTTISVRIHVLYVCENDKIKIFLIIYNNINAIFIGNCVYYFDSRPLDRKVYVIHDEYSNRKNIQTWYFSF